MSSAITRCSAVVLLFMAATFAAAQTDYKVISVTDGGTISGTIKWSGPVPHQLDFPVTKDPQICDPEGKKTVSLERLIVGPEGGIPNTIVYLKNIFAGKVLELPEQRRHLDQRHCHYIPHILLVPQSAVLQMQSSDATLHTIHMSGAASYNLPFPFPNQISSRTMSTPGLVNLRCNGGHVWMNAEMMVVPHPYYAVTDESGRFGIRQRTSRYLSDRCLARRLGTGGQGASLRRPHPAHRTTANLHRTKDLGEIGHGQRQPAQHGQFCAWEQIVLVCPS